MKCRIFFAAVLIITAAFVGRWVTRSNNPHASAGRDVTRKTFKLDAGARVEVRGVNGFVEVRTADTDTADVQVVRTADGDGSLENSNLSIEGSPSGLVVSCENHDGGRGFWRWLSGGGNVREEVTLTLPRRVELLTKGVNGPVRVGEVEGPVSVEGVNGKVEVAGSSGRVAMKGVNGQVKFVVARLGGDGMEIKGVNGNVEVRFKELPDADIDVKGNNGGLTLNVPNVTMQEREGHSNMRARLGAGGSRIEIRGVNGQIRFEYDLPSSSNTTTAATTTTTTNTHSSTTTAPAAHSDGADEAPEAPEDDSEPPPPPPPPAQ